MKSFALILCCMLVTAAYAQQYPELNKADACYKAYDYACAGENYKAALAIHKYPEASYAEILYRVGNSIQVGKDQDQERKPWFLKALAVNPNHKAANWDLAAGYYRLDKKDSAIVYYTKAIELYKDEPSSLASMYRWRAHAHEILYKYSNAKADYLKAEELAPNDPDVLWDIASFYFNSEVNYQSAYAYYTKALQNNHSTPGTKAVLNRNLALSQLRLHNYKLAEGHINASIKDSSSYGAAYQTLADIARQQKDWKKVTAAVDKALPLTTDEYDRADLLSWRGQSYLSAKKTEEANMDFEAALEEDEFNVAANKALGDYYYAKNDLKKAYEHYINVTVDWDGEEADTKSFYFNLAKSALDQNSGTTTKDYMKKYIALDAANWEAYKLLGIAYYRDANGIGLKDALKNYDLSIEKYKGTDKVIKGELFADRGQLHYDNKEYEVAKNDLLKAKELDKTNLDARQNLANVCYMLKDYATADKEVVELIPMVPVANTAGLAGLNYLRGLIAYAQKNKTEALQDFTKALALNPAHKEAQQWKEYLEKGGQ